MPKKETQPTLKAYIITYTLTHVSEGENDTRSVVVIAYEKKEAGDLFIKWLQAKETYNNVGGVVVQRTKKTKRNANMITPAFYQRQNKYVDDLFKEHVNRKADA